MKALFGFALGVLTVAALANDAPTTLPPPKPMASLIGAVFNVSNPQKEIAFYRDGLGMTLAMTLKGKTATEYMMSFGGDPRQPGIILQHADQQTGSLRQGTAFNRLVLRAVDLDALTAKLREAGYVHTPIRDVAKGYRMTMATDPEGYRLEIVQSAARN